VKGSRQSIATWGLEKITFFAVAVGAVILPNTYVLGPQYTVYRIAFLFAIQVALLAASKKARLWSAMGPATSRLFLASLAFSTYMLLVDVVQNGAAQGVLDFLIRLTVIGLAPIGALLLTDFWWRVRILVGASMIPMVFGAVQVFNPDFSLPSLTPANPLVGFHTREGLEGYIAATGRIVGTSNISIGFALLLGVVAVLAYGLWRHGGSGRLSALAGISSVLLAPMTLTRSLIVGLLPSLGLGRILAGRSTWRSALVAVSVAVGLSMVLWVVLPRLGGVDPRVAQFDDNNTRVKLVSNLYGVRYALQTRPLTGIAKAELYQAVVDEYQAGDLPVGVSVDALLTNHNQFGYLLRFYGLLGLALLLLTYGAMLRLIFTLQDANARAALLGVMIYVTQFSLLHNVFVYSVPVLWLLLWGIEEDRPASDCKAGVNAPTTRAVIS